MADRDVSADALHTVLDFPVGTQIVGVTWIMDTASVRFHLAGEVPHARSTESEKGPDRTRKKQQRVAND